MSVFEGLQMSLHRLARKKQPGPPRPLGQHDPDQPATPRVQLSDRRECGLLCGTLADGVAAVFCHRAAANTTRITRTISSSLRFLSFSLTRLSKEPNCRQSFEQ